jgi:formate--tetrahydrofolate ligase
VSLRSVDTMPADGVLDDLAIARGVVPEAIGRVAARLGLTEADWESYGRYKAKLTPECWERIGDRPDGRLVLVSAISPTPAGEGKTTMTIGLGQALCHLGEKAIVAIREPSLGPVFGVKGGACGGGRAQVVPMTEINLHFNGDFHAITAANNLLAALIDNHLHHGNALRLDPRRITFQRAMDMNDRALRHVVLGLGGQSGGVPREAGFVITPASEVMAILCLAQNLADLKARLGQIVVGYDQDGVVVRADALEAADAMAGLLKDAVMPNLVQTLEHTPALVHGGPFANIAHGCNSLVATRYALKLGDWVVTEAGFGADLGAQKFIDIKCRVGDLKPAAVVLVATVRSLKWHGDGHPDPLSAGFANLKRHYLNITQHFGLPCVVALNRFAGDTDAEIAWLKAHVAELGGELVIADCHANGGAGGVDLARAVMRAAVAPQTPRFSYDALDSPREKIRKIARNVYGANDVIFGKRAEKDLEALMDSGFATAPVCIAKTQYSFSDDPTRRGAPDNWDLHVRELRPAGGAGFIVALCGDVMTMPGLPAHPAATRMQLDAGGVLHGLF